MCKAWTNFLSNKHLYLFITAKGMHHFFIQLRISILTHLMVAFVLCLLLYPEQTFFSCKSFAHAFESDVQKGSFSQNNFICHVWTYVLINIHKLISTIFLLCLKDFQQFPVVKALSDHLDQLQKQK